MEADSPLLVAVWYAEQLVPYDEDIETFKGHEKWAAVEYAQRRKRKEASLLAGELRQQYGDDWLSFRDEAQDMDPEKRKRLLEGGNR